MITLIATLCGFFAPFTSSLIKIWQDKNDKAHELSILQLQMEVAKDSAVAHAEEIGATAYATQVTAIYQNDKTNINWVEAYKAIVRPTIAFAFFFTYVAVKYIQYTLIGDHAPSFQYLDIMWTDDDKAIFASVIAFYFGERTKRGMSGK